MYPNCKPLIAVDAGHGGWDNGASYNGRLEKDDNLRMAQEVRRQLVAQGIGVLMTRDADVYVTLEDRARMANEAGADLFISLHRNSYPESTPYTNGVENFIYLTAPEETDGRAAQLVLERVVEMGVQSNRGVSRGDYSVLRNTVMPSMLFENGFIINDLDNQLFDEHLIDYAAATAGGIMEYFGLTYQYIPGISPPSMQPPPTPPLTRPELDAAIAALNQLLGVDIPAGPVTDATRKGFVRALQQALNLDFDAGLKVDGILGPLTLAAFPGSVHQNQRGRLVTALQGLLVLNGYALKADGVFGPITKSAVRMFQRDNYLPSTGIVDRETLALLAG